jgi:mannose-6-phosphate isomerase-like protein (cupin superfamily)
VVHAGQAEFQVDHDRVVARAGDIVVAPARAARRFANTGTEQLRLTAIHAAGRFDTEWIGEGST